MESEQKIESKLDNVYDKQPASSKSVNTNADSNDSTLPLFFNDTKANGHKKKLHELIPKKPTKVVIGYIVLFLLSAFILAFILGPTAGLYSSRRYSQSEESYAPLYERYASSAAPYQLHEGAAYKKATSGEGEAASSDDALQSNSNSNDDNKKDARYIVKNGAIAVSIKGRDANQKEGYNLIRAFADLVIEAVSKRNGYISSHNEDGYRRLILSTRIPVDAFDTFIKEVGNLCSTVTSHIDSIASAEVTHMSSTSTDETAKILDWSVREKSLRGSHARMLELLKTAKDIKDLLEIEREISRITADLDQILSKSNNMIRKAKMSELTISIIYESNNGTSGQPNPFMKRLIQALDNALLNILLFIEETFIVAALGIVYIVPITLLCGFIMLCIKCCRSNQQ